MKFFLKLASIAFAFAVVLPTNHLKADDSAGCANCENVDYMVVMPYMQYYEPSIKSCKGSGSFVACKIDDFPTEIKVELNTFVGEDYSGDTTTANNQCYIDGLPCGS